MKRVKYNKGNVDSAVDAAKRLKSDKPLYIFATALGFMIDTAKPPFGRKYLTVHPDGKVSHGGKW